MRELVVGALLIFGLMMGAAPRAVAQPIDPVLGPVWDRLRSELHHGERLRLRVEEAQEGGDTRLNYVLGDLRSEQQRERVLCYCLACKPDQVAARRASCAAEVLGRYRGHYGEPKLHQGLAIGGGVLIALGVGVAVMGGVLYGVRELGPSKAACEWAELNEGCIWGPKTAISGAVLGGVAISAGISLLVLFNRERGVILEIEGK